MYRLYFERKPLFFRRLRWLLQALVLTWSMPVLADPLSSDMQFFPANVANSVDAAHVRAFDDVWTQTAIKTWQSGQSRTNLYLSNGLAELDAGHDAKNPRTQKFITGIGLDYLDRNFYTSAKVENFTDPEFYTRSKQQLKLGFSAFDFEDEGMGAFLMLMLQRADDSGRALRITPGLELFGREFEGGLSYHAGQYLIQFHYTW